MGQTFDLLASAGVIDGELALRLKKAVGFRNVAVHQYESIDWNIVHAIAQRHLDDFGVFASVILARLVTGPAANSPRTLGQ